MYLSPISRTAILTLVCRVVASEKKNPIFNDPIAVLCLERLMSIASEEEKNRMVKWKKCMQVYKQGMQGRALRL
jgi:O-methyltransferase involved in polyketide biosynthesis